VTADATRSAAALPPALPGTGSRFHGDAGAEGVEGADSAIPCAPPPAGRFSTVRPIVLHVAALVYIVSRPGRLETEVITELLTE